MRNNMAPCVNTEPRTKDIVEAARGVFGMLPSSWAGLISRDDFFSIALWASLASKPLLVRSDDDVLFTLLVLIMKDGRKLCKSPSVLNEVWLHYCSLRLCRRCFCSSLRSRRHYALLCSVNRDRRTLSWSKFKCHGALAIAIFHVSQGVLQEMRDIFRSRWQAMTRQKSEISLWWPILVNLVA